MTKSIIRRAVLAGDYTCAFSQDAPTNLKSLHHKPMASAAFGAGLSIIYRNADAIAETKPSW